MRYEQKHWNRLDHHRSNNTFKFLRKTFLSCRNCFFLILCQLVFCLIIIGLTFPFGPRYFNSLLLSKEFLPLDFVSPPLPYSAPPFSSYPHHWDPPQTVLRSFRPAEMIHPGKNGNYGGNTTDIRKSLIDKFNTVYGCLSDPIVAAARRKQPTRLKWMLDDSPLPENSIPDNPAKIAFLFLSNGGISHAKVWSSWFREAREWSQQYMGQQMSTFFKQSNVLFSVYIHKGGNGNEIFDKSINGTLDDDIGVEVHWVPTVPNAWGNLNWVEHQLLHSAFKERQNGAFIFISDSTVPVKPFYFMYEDFKKNPRSRFYFSDVNFPLLRKHDQWVVLNRPHAQILLQHPERWVCDQWLMQPFGRMPKKWAAPDEYLSFHTLGEIIGVSTIQSQINNGITYQYPAQDFYSSQVYYSGLEFRHTFSCWVNQRDKCDILGHQFVRRASPSEFYSVNAAAFEQYLLTHRYTWFARKFSRDCRIALPGNSSEIPSSGTSWDFRIFGVLTISKNRDERIRQLPLLSDWLIQKLASWKETLESKVWDGPLSIVNILS